MVSQRGEIHALHFPDLIVWLQDFSQSEIYNFNDDFIHHSSTLAHEHGVVCSLEHLGEKHLVGKKSENQMFSRQMNKYQGPRGWQALSR